MILEQVQTISSLVLVLILVWYTIKYRSWLVATVLVIGVYTLLVANTEAEQDSIWFTALGQLNAGLLTYLIYDYMKTKQAYVKLLHAKHTRALGKAANYAIVGVDVEGKVVNWHESAHRLYGWDEDEVRGKLLTEFLVPKNRLSEHEEIVRRVTAGETIHDFRTARQRKDGSRVLVDITASPVKDSANGTIIGITSIASEVGDEKAH